MRKPPHGGLLVELDEGETLLLGHGDTSILASYVGKNGRRVRIVIKAPREVFIERLNRTLRPNAIKPAGGGE